MTVLPSRGALVRLRALAALVVLSFLLAGLVAVTGPARPAAAAPKTTLTLTGKTQIRYGQQATLKVRWTKSGTKATGTVRLQRKVDGVWVDHAKVKVSKGKASVKVAPTSSTRYRVKAGSKVSKSFKVTVVKKWVSFSAKDTKIRAGEQARLKVSNYVKGKRKAGTVEVQSRSGKSWTTVATVTLGAKGWDYVPVSPTATTVYRAVNGSVVSLERTVEVTRDWVDLEVAEAQVAASGQPTLARVRWYAKGKPGKGTVTLQEKVGSGSWKDVTTVKVVDGVAEVELRPQTTRRYRAVAGGVKSQDVSVQVLQTIPESFVIKGGGWGHGLGMSQYGAYAMARAGKSVEQILTHYYRDTTVEQMSFPTGNDGAEQLSVQVLGPSADSRSSATLSVVDGGWRLRSSAGTTVATQSKAGSVTFKVESGKLAAYVGASTTPVATDTLFRLHWEGTRYYLKDSTRKTYVKVAGAHGTYRHGRMEVSVIGGKVNVVNNLLLNTEYLYGIAEMPSSWGRSGPAALQAQAIAARNYAASKFFGADGKPRKITAGCRCHIYDDTRDQYFSGWTKENEGTNAQYGKLWKAAVDATVSEGGAKGKVLRYTGSNSSYKGKLVTAYYSSSTGGATLNSEDVWSAAVPYLRSVDDPWSLDEVNPSRSWEATFTQAQARSFFGLPDVVSIEVSRTYAGGGLAELTATSSSGKTAKVSGKADTMRTRLNAAASGYVKSAFVRSVDPVR